MIVQKSEFFPKITLLGAFRVHFPFAEVIKKTSPQKITRKAPKRVRNRFSSREKDIEHGGSKLWMKRQ
jgi:hypothetical protein